MNDITLQVNSDNLIKDVITKYQSKLQNDKIKNIFFKKEDGKYIVPEKKLEEVGIKNNSIIYAEYDEENENLYGIPESELVNLKKTMKEKLKQGLITIQIINNELGSDFYYVEDHLRNFLSYYTLY